MEGLIRKDTAVRDGGFKLAHKWCRGRYIACVSTDAGACAGGVYCPTPKSLRDGLGCRSLHCSSDPHLHFSCRTILGPLSPPS